MCRECWVLPSGVEFSTEENRPAKFQLEEFEVCTEDEARLWNEQIDELIANTSLLCPPNRSVLHQSLQSLFHNNFIKLTDDVI